MPDRTYEVGIAVSKRCVSQTISGTALQYALVTFSWLETIKSRQGRVWRRSRRRTKYAKWFLRTTNVSM